MIKRHEVQVLLREGLSERRVSRRTGVSRRSVQRIAEEAAVEELFVSSPAGTRGVGRPLGREQIHRSLTRSRTPSTWITHTRATHADFDRRPDLERTRAIPSSEREEVIMKSLILASGLATFVGPVQPILAQGEPPVPVSEMVAAFEENPNDVSFLAMALQACPLDPQSWQYQFVSALFASISAKCGE